MEALHHCVFSLNHHLVLVTKYHRRVLTGDMLTRSGVLTKGAVRRLGRADAGVQRRAGP